MESEDPQFSQEKPDTVTRRFFIKASLATFALPAQDKISRVIKVPKTDQVKPDGKLEEESDQQKLYYENLQKFNNEKFKTPEQQEQDIIRLSEKMQLPEEVVRLIYHANRALYQKVELNRGYEFIPDEYLLAIVRYEHRGGSIEQAITAEVKNEDGSYDRGLWQINSIHDGELSREEALNPLDSTIWAINFIYEKAHIPLYGTIEIRGLNSRQRLHIAAWRYNGYLDNNDYPDKIIYLAENGTTPQQKGDISKIDTSNYKLTQFQVDLKM